MKNKFTLKQVFSLVDGRLSTSMEDIHIMLGIVMGGSIFTHQLPTALDYLKSQNQIWFIDATKLLNNIKDVHGDDFETLMKVIDSEYSDVYFEITKI